MRLIQDNALLIVGILLVLIIIEGLIIYFQHKNRRKGKGTSKGGSSGSVYKEKYEKTREEREALRSKVEQLKKEYRTKEREHGDLNVKYQRIKDDYGKVIVENQQLSLALEKVTTEKSSLEIKVGELTRKNAEQNKLLGNAPTSIVEDTASEATSTPIIPKSESKEEPANNAETNSSQPPVQDDASPEVTQETNAPKADTKVEPSAEKSRNEVPKEEQKNEVPKEEPKVEPAKERTMYASFPRSAGSNIYFSDLSENRVDDSYFELKVSVASGKATFKPLDFMKIRNYDPAMAAMLTEGVKPNIASTVIGIEPGKAHIEGKDWIIDNLAKIKLA